jgi:putative copper resistance protein D
MLSGVYISLRFIHFHLADGGFGCVLYGAWWAPVALRRLLMQRFYPLCAIYYLQARCRRC